MHACTPALYVALERFLTLVSASDVAQRSKRHMVWEGRKKKKEGIQPRGLTGQAYPPKNLNLTSVGSNGRRGMRRGQRAMDEQRYYSKSIRVRGIGTGECVPRAIEEGRGRGCLARAGQVPYRLYTHVTGMLYLVYASRTSDPWTVLASAEENLRIGS
jgi:hypothetical protein